jgi:hypothetical protein
MSREGVMAALASICVNERNIPEHFNSAIEDDALSCANESQRQEARRKPQTCSESHISLRPGWL